MNETHQYEVDVQWNTDSKGTLSSPVLPIQIVVATPPEFPNGIKDIWSPEHLFIASVNSCIMTTFLTIAANSKIEFESYKSNAVGKVEYIDGIYSITEIMVKPMVVVSVHQRPDRVKRVLEMSEKACVISSSVKSKITLESTITIKS